MKRLGTPAPRHITRFLGAPFSAPPLGARQAFPSAFEFGEDEEGFEIGAEIEQIARCELAGHQRAGGSGFFRSVEEAAHLTYAHPLDRIDQRNIFRLRLPLEGGHDDPRDPGATGALDHKARVVPSSCDQKQRGG